MACNLLRSGMAAKLIFIAAAALAVVPAATSVVWPGRNGEEVSRTVQLRGPFIEFEQTHERIHLRLAPASAAETGARERIVVRADGYEIAIPLKHGQTWASAELPAPFADAAALEISLQP